jgi:hypothetical protein
MRKKFCGGFSEPRGSISRPYLLQISCLAPIPSAMALLGTGA